MTTVSAGPQTTAALPALGETAAAPATVHAPGPGTYLIVDDGTAVVTAPLKEGLTKVGRGFSCDIRLEDPALSRAHAIITRHRGQTTILDNRSSNGVHVNGARVDQAELRHGDVIRLGRVSLRYVEVPA
jgi:pSer/pThr/pTyr-binding forkhead associated (FHA) protein